MNTMNKSIYFASFILFCTAGKSTSFDMTSRSIRIKSLTAKQTKTHHALNVCDSRDIDRSKVSSFQVSMPSIPEANVSEPKRIDWDYIATANSVFESDKRPVILFDGVCNLCNGGVNFALDHDNKGKEYAYCRNYEP
jgi:hypothetical protein